MPRSASNARITRGTVLFALVAGADFANAFRAQESERVRIAHELSTLNESLQTLAYAALGQQGPQVRRRRSA